MVNEGEGTTRLSTVDAEGRRLWVYPSDVSGKYRTRRNWVNGALVVIFLLLPWVRIGGDPALLLDVWNGRFSIFGLRFWSHDAPMLFFILGGAAVLLAFVTAVWGRVWCGWACPQTVFVDFLFRSVERWIEGNSVDRRRRDLGPMSREKFFKKSGKWACYLLISVVLSHGFLAYFVGTDALARMVSHSPLRNPGSFIAMGVISAAVLFDFGWLREQFCVLICPYGRFQSVLMDERSLAITYDKSRSDCIDCRKCVQVCPTGIDIRDGLQLECVACTSCVDACDGVMTKIGKPTGLIRYLSGWGRGKGGYAKPAAYFGVLSVFFVALVWTVRHREPVQMTVIRSVGSLFEEVIRPGLEKEVVNRFKIDLLNQSFEGVRVEMAAGLAPLGMQIVSPGLPLELAPGEARQIDVFLRFPLSQLQEGKGRVRIPAIATSKNWSAPLKKDLEVPLVGPLR